MLAAHEQIRLSSHTYQQVDSPDSLENVESKWVGEIAENCPGVRLVLVALKCDLREQQADEDETTAQEPKKAMIDYKQGLAVAEKIKALRYLGMMIGVTIQEHSRAPCMSQQSAKNLLNRMLSHEEPRRQRGFYRSRSRRTTSQECERGQPEQVYSHVVLCPSCLPCFLCLPYKRSLAPGVV